ncbi:MAG: hypothetical protein QXI95_02015 [Candidatus Micrarchaeaceae archaeon]
MDVHKQDKTKQGPSNAKYKRFNKYFNKYIAIAIIGIIIAVAVVYYFTSSNNLYFEISANIKNNSLNMQVLGNLIETKIKNINEINVTYIGNIATSFSAHNTSSTETNQHILINLQKYYTSSKITFANNLSLGTSNSIIVMINNISTSYECSKLYPLTNFTCAPAAYNASLLPSIFASIIGAPSSNSTLAGSPSPMLYITSIKQSSYNYLSCVNITGYIKTNLSIQNVSFCLSNDYYIPLTAKESIHNFGMTMNMSINETNLSLLSSPSINSPMIK